MVKVLLSQLQAAGIIPELPDGAVEPSVATGLEAIGRGQDLQKLDDFIQIATAIGQLAEDTDINVRTLKQRAANALGIDSDGLLLSLEELQQKQAQEAAAQGMQSAAQTGGAAMGQGMGENPAAAAQMMQEQM